MKTVKRLSIMHLFIYTTFVVCAACGLSNIAVARPTPATTNTPTINGTAATAMNATISAGQTSPAESPLDRLRRLCNSSLDMGSLDPDNDAIVKAVGDGLEKFYREHPDEEISSCVVEVPDPKVYVDQRIKTYNVSKNSNERFGTAFLLVGKAYGVTMKESESSCTLEQTFIVGKSNGVASEIPKKWSDDFLLKEPITLDSGQKLIGIPIDVSRVALAENYHVSIARKIWGSIACRGYHYSPVFRGVGKDHLIKITGSGGVVSGITNAKAFNYSRTYTKDCYWSGTDWQKRVIAADKIYKDMIKVELHPMGMNYPEGHKLVKITLRVDIKPYQ